MSWSDKKQRPGGIKWNELRTLPKGVPAAGRHIALTATKDSESPVRQILLCKDQSGVTKRVEFYNDARGLPGLKVGGKFSVKNPVHYVFPDKKEGMRISEEEMVNVTLESKKN